VDDVHVGEDAPKPCIRRLDRDRPGSRGKDDVLCVSRQVQWVVT